MTRQASDANARAETTAAAAFAFITRDPERIERFLAVTGLAAADVQSVAAEPAFLRGVLDHLLEDELLLLSFCEETGLTPGDIWSARRALGGLPTERG